MSFSLTLWKNRVPVYNCDLCKASFPKEELALAHLDTKHYGKYPLITCLMVTTKVRKNFFATSFRHFFQQTYPNLEMLVVSEDAEVLAYLPDFPNIRFVLAPENCTSIGAKRNLGIATARGQYIAHWDDDDWHLPNRIQSQYDHLTNSKAELVGTRHPRFVNVQEQHMFRYKGHKAFFAGGSLMYSRAIGEAFKFPEITIGEDWRFVREVTNTNIHVSHHTEDWQVFKCHPGNTCQKEGWDDNWLQDEYRDLEPVTPSVVLGRLHWNNTNLQQAHTSFLMEQARFAMLGIPCRLMYVDNGSSHQQEFLGAYVYNLEQNVGNAVARNILIKEAQDYAEYLLLMDGDIDLVPGSAVALVSRMQQLPDYACLGLWSGGHTAQANKVTPHVTTFFDRMVIPNADVAWTQYGLFRLSALEDIAFDNNFGVGWGFEDNDLAFQFVANGQRIGYLRGVTYFHDYHSSWRSLPNVEELFEQRKAYLVKKWCQHPLITISRLLSAITAAGLQKKR